MKCPLYQICVIHITQPEICFYENGRDWECCFLWCKFRMQFEMFTEYKLPQNLKETDDFPKRRNK